MNVLVTGGAGFIGSHFARLLLTRYENYHVIVLDALTYAGQISSLKDIWDHPRFRFYPGKIQDGVLIDKIIEIDEISHIVNFAADTHNDRLLLESCDFIQTNTYGVYILLQATHRHRLERMLHISTDEVYGSIDDGAFTELSPLKPNTPYSASKAGGDMQVLAHHLAFRTPTILTRGANTYGPNQYPEKLIPLFTTQLIDSKKVPLYGNGEQSREWMHVLDHCDGIDLLLHKGKMGEIYNIGSQVQRQNSEIVQTILHHTGRDNSFVQRIPDPRGETHDQRYAMFNDKLCNLGWAPQRSLEEYLPQTIKWYSENQDWWRTITSSSEYQDFYQKFNAKYFEPYLVESFKQDKLTINV